MKKIISVITAFAFICVVSSVYAAEVYFHTAKPPSVVSSAAKAEENDIIYSISFSSDASVAETLRKTMCDGLFEKGFTYDEIASSTSSFLLQKTVNLCQLSLDGGQSWIPVKAYSSDQVSVSLSLFADVLPAIKNSSPNLCKYIDGFDFVLRLITVSENYTENYEGTVFVCTEGSETLKFSAPAFGFITYSLTDDAVNAPENPEFFFTPLTRDIILFPASRKGCVFDGWSIGGESRIGKIPAGTVSECLISNWLPKTYAINYILTINTDNMFGRADNAKNPVSYVFDEKTAIYDIKSPVIGFSFDGWYLSADFSGEKINEIPKNSTGDILLYAKWTSNKEEKDRIKKEKEEQIKNFGYGDVDNDGVVTAADARAILRAVVGLEKIPDMLLKRADYYNSNIITAENARTTLRIAVGLDNLYDVLTKNGVI